MMDGLPVLPDTNLQLPPPPVLAAPIQLPQDNTGVPSPSPTPVPPTAPDFAARRGAWANFLSLLKTNPEIGQALLNFSAGALRPRGIGQTGGSVLANAAAGTANMMNQQQMRDRAFAFEQQKAKAQQDYQQGMLGVAQTEAQTGQQRAATEAKTAQSTAQLEQAKLKLLQSSSLDDSNFKKAQTKYYNSLADNLGMSGDAGSRLKMVQEMANAAVTLGQFKGKNAASQAFIWASQSVLGTKNANDPQAFLNTMAQNALKAQEEINGGNLTSDQMQQTINGVQQVFQSMVKQGFFTQNGIQPSGATGVVSGTPPDLQKASQAFTADPRAAQYAAAGYKLGPIDPKNGLYTIIAPDGTVINNGVGLYKPQQ